MKVLIKIPEEWLDKTDVPTAEEWEEIVMSGQPLPDDCEILTKEAYADLCVRASKGNCSEIPTGSEKLSSELEKNSKKLEKDFGELDCISRKFMCDLGATCIAYRNDKQELIPIISIDNLPSVAPQESIEKCKWIKYDHRTMCPKEHIDVDSPYWRIPENRMETLKYCPYCGKEIEVEV